MAKFVEKTEIMDKEQMDRAMRRMAYEIIENHKGTENLYIIGIQRRGVALGKQLVEEINGIEKNNIGFGILDITLYRDDLSQLNEHPVINGTDIAFKVEGAKIILVDDVLYTGRTIRAALDATIDLGRPASVQLAVLIDRGHREFPFKADFVGKNVPTSKNEIIHVEVMEFDGKDRVVIGVKE